MSDHRCSNLKQLLEGGRYRYQCAECGISLSSAELRLRGGPMRIEYHRALTGKDAGK